MIPEAFLSRYYSEFLAALGGAKWTAGGNLATDGRFTFYRVSGDRKATLKASLFWVDPVDSNTWIVPTYTSDEPMEIGDAGPGIEVLAETAPPAPGAYRGTSVVFSDRTLLALAGN